MRKNFIYNLFSCIILFLVFTFSISQAQVLNGDFENWTNGNPDSWTTDNVTSTSLIPITQSTDKYSGSYAVKGEVMSVYSQIYPPELWQYSSINQKYTSLTGYYKFNPANSSDVLSISVVVLDSSSYTGGAGDTLIATATSAYKKFTLPITYIPNSATPQQAYILIVIDDTSDTNNGNPAVGSNFILDNLQLTGGTTGIANNGASSPERFALNQNYPNPFNPTTTIEYQIPRRSHVLLEIYDILGNKIRTLVNEEESSGYYKINFNASNLPSGVYLYRIVAGNFNQTKKLILLK